MHTSMFQTFESPESEDQTKDMEKSAVKRLCLNCLKYVIFDFFQPAFEQLLLLETSPGVQVIAIVQARANQYKD